MSEIANYKVSIPVNGIMYWGNDKTIYKACKRLIDDLTSGHDIPRMIENSKEAIVKAFDKDGNIVPIDGIRSSTKDVQESLTEAFEGKASIGLSMAKGYWKAMGQQKFIETLDELEADIDEWVCDQFEDE